MTIPALGQDGLLPPGVHDCTLTEVKERFGAFQGTDKRPRLFDALARYYKEASSTGVVVAVYVDGSFVTSKETPGDVDIIVVVKEDALPNATVDLPPHIYNVVSKRVIKKTYPFDVFVVPEGGDTTTTWVEFFSQVKGDAQARKGILRVTP